MALTITFEGIAIVIATFAGPIVAVYTTRWLDERKLRRERQRSVFDTLMLTRRTPLFPEHVRALNQIELEFSDDQTVMTAFQAYFDNLNERLADTATPSEVERFQARRRRLFAGLVKVIGERQRFRIDKMDLMEGGYYPAGWEDDEARGRDNARMFNDLLAGRRPLWIAATPVPPPASQGGAAPRPIIPTSPFPPPPED